MQKTSTITFDQSGGIRVEQTGFVGTACAETTKKLMDGIGAEQKSEKRKPEYNMVNRAGTGARQTTRG